MLTRLRSTWRDALALLFALRDPRTPAGSRGLALIALIYAVSPIDLLPDTLPGLGIMDDILIVPTLLALAARQLPPQVLTQARGRSAFLAARAPYLIVGAALVAVGLLWGLGSLLWHGLHG